jgi:hypothetical protein
VHPDREKSDGLEDEINHELQRLGYPKCALYLSSNILLIGVSQLKKKTSDDGT